MGKEGPRRLLPIVALVIGIPLTIAGVFLVGAYVVGVVDIIVNQPADRSWIFWGLGVVFIGITLLVAGAALLVMWRKSRSAAADDREGLRDQ